MAQRWSNGGKAMVGNEDRYSTRLGGITDPRQYLSPLCFRSLGERLAQEVCARRSGSDSLRGRYHLRFPISGRRGSFSGESPGTVAEVWIGTSSRQDAPGRVRAVCRTEPGTKRGRQT